MVGETGSAVTEFCGQASGQLSPGTTWLTPPDETKEGTLFSNGHSDTRFISAGPRCFLLSCFDDAPERVQGGHGYSYDRALEVFLPLLKELRTVIPIARPESQLEYAIERARLCGSSPVALSFLPLQNVFFTRSAPAVVYLFWEFPDLPTRELNDNPRFDWARLAPDPEGAAGALGRARERDHASRRLPRQPL